MDLKKTRFALSIGSWPAFSSSGFCMKEIGGLHATLTDDLKGEDRFLTSTLYNPSVQHSKKIIGQFCNTVRTKRVEEKPTVILINLLGHGHCVGNKQRFCVEDGFLDLQEDIFKPISECVRATDVAFALIDCCRTLKSGGSEEGDPSDFGGLLHSAYVKGFNLIFAAEPASFAYGGALTKCFCHLLKSSSAVQKSLQYRELKSQLSITVGLAAKHKQTPYFCGTAKDELFQFITSTSNVTGIPSAPPLKPPTNFPTWSMTNNTLSVPSKYTGLLPTTATRSTPVINIVPPSGVIAGIKLPISHPPTMIDLTNNKNAPIIAQNTPLTATGSRPPVQAPRPSLDAIHPTVPEHVLEEAKRAIDIADLRKQFTKVGRNKHVFTLFMEYNKNNKIISEWTLRRKHYYESLWDKLKSESPSTVTDWKEYTKELKR